MKKGKALKSKRKKALKKEAQKVLNAYENSGMDPSFQNFPICFFPLDTKPQGEVIELRGGGCAYAE